MNAQTQTKDLVVVGETAPTRKDARVVVDVVPILDTARFEHMQRIATAIANSSLLPDSLRLVRDGDKWVELPHNVVVSNCFLVVNQAVRWGMEPFAVTQSISIVKGKLCYEGKLIAAVIDAKLGIRLNHTFEGAERSDSRKITVSGRFPDETVTRTVSGTVADWKTTGPGSPWRPSTYDDMLIYRGARVWARRHCPSLMLGVYTDDELEDLSVNASSNRARNVTPVPADDGPPDPAELDKAKEPAAAEPAKTEVAMTEAGRDDGKTVVWEDDGPPAPDSLEDVPGFLDRTVTPAEKALLDQLATIENWKDMAHFVQGTADPIGALAPEAQKRVREAITKRQSALSQS